MHKARSRRVLSLSMGSLCGVALLCNGRLQAQQSPQADASPQSTGELQEIIVTARKREESLISVPVVEVAIPQAQLEKLQTVDITDLPDVVPGLQFGRGLLTIGTQVSIRGVGTTSLDQGVDQSVSLNIDGMAPGTGLAFSSGMFDIGQVEVLKGPQALFFGKSSPGGVISLRTADPTDQFEVIGRTSYEFESSTPREEAIISGPIVDTFKARLAAMYQSSDGYFRNTGVAAPGFGGATPTDSHGPSGHDYTIRGTLLWSPVDQFDARLKLNLVEDYATDAEIIQFSDCPEGSGFAPFHGIPFIGNDNCKISKNNRTIWMDPAAFPGIINHGAPYTDTQQEFATLELNYRPIQDVTITSVTADYHVKATSLANSIATVSAGTPLASENFFHRRELTEELRASSDFKFPVNFTAGAFYEDGLVDELVYTVGNTAEGLPGDLGGERNPVYIRAKSLYGQGRWEIVPRLELAAGLRWSDETRTEELVTPLGPVSTLQPRVHADNVSPEFTLTYRPTDDLTAFAAWKEGFKSGSFSIDAPVTPGTNNAFGEETVRGAEAGLKTRWLNRRLTANVAGYFYNYSGLQVGAVQPAVAGDVASVATHTVNAGAARVYGVDFDAAYHPSAIEGLGLNAAVDWNHARYLTLDNVPCYGGQTIAAGCNQAFNPFSGLYTAQNLAGTPLIRAPAWQVQGGFNYDYVLARNYKLSFSNNNSFSSRYVTFLAIGRPNQDNYQGSYIKSDVSVSLSGPDDGWELALIGRNVGDKLTAGQCTASNFAAGVLFGGEITGGTATGPAGIDQAACFVDPGREVWIRLTVRPFASAH